MWYTHHWITITIPRITLNGAQVSPNGKASGIGFTAYKPHLHLSLSATIAGSAIWAEAFEDADTKHGGQGPQNLVFTS